MLGRGRPATDQADDSRQERQRPLAGVGEQALGGEDAPGVLQPGEEGTFPDRADLVDGERQGAAETAPRTWRLQVSWTDIAAAVSRRVRKTVDEPGRCVSCATWPSTQTGPSRSIQVPIAWDITRTGAGCSGEVSNATRASLA